MRSTLIHYHVVDYLSGTSTFVSLASLASIVMYRDFPLTHFLPLQMSRSERRINWAQTFARKGFEFADYSALNGYNLHRGAYFFTRHLAAGPGPESLHFAPGGDPESTLQGDLVTYIVAERGLCLEPVATLHNAARGSFLRALLGDSIAGVHSRWWAESQDIALVSREIKRSRTLWKDNVIDAWNATRSLVHLSYQAH
jgi:hypothetical protein